MAKVKGVTMRVRSLIAISLSLAICVSTMPAYGDDTDDYLALFSGVCLLNMHVPQAISTYAELNEWKPIPPKYLPGLAPQTGKIEGGWIARFANVKGFLVVSRAVERGKAIWSCAVGGKLPKPTELATRLNSRFQAKLISNKVEGFQRFRMYIVSSIGTKYFVNLVSGEHPKVRDMFSLSVTPWTR